MAESRKRSRKKPLVAGDAPALEDVSDLPRPAPVLPDIHKQRYSKQALIGVLMALDWLIIIWVNLLALTFIQSSVLDAPLILVLPYVCTTILCAWGLWVTRTYEINLARGLRRHILKLMTGYVLATVIAALSVIPFTGDMVFLKTVGLGFALLPYPLLAVHLLFFAFIAHTHSEGQLAYNVVLVGATDQAEGYIVEAKKQSDTRIIGIFDDRTGRIPAEMAGVPVLGTIDDMLNWEGLPFVDKVLVSLPITAEGRMNALLTRLRALPNPIAVLTNVHRFSPESTRVQTMGALSMAYVSGMRNDDVMALSKRIQDLVIGSIALVVFAPVMMLTALAIRLESPGPVIFKQKRHGFNNQIITVYKFRSMRAEASDPACVRQVQKDDDRITRVGRFIRKTSIDELPQIFNVLKGDMSLVGPRPHAIGMRAANKEMQELVAHYAHRHRMKPGITGWAQINGSRGACTTPEDVERRVVLDLDYIARAHFWLDLWIMIMTIPRFLGDRETVR